MDAAAAEGAHDEHSGALRDSAAPPPLEEEDEYQLLFKTRPCKYALMEIACLKGDQCSYAHSPEELRPIPESYRERLAPHWQGAAVCIGVVEHAMFWDIPPSGTTDVVCNRASCLGNPFANVLYEEAPALDREGWCPREHADLCSAFEEYLRGLLAPPVDPEETLQAMVGRLASARNVTLAETWLLQRLDRARVLGALDALKRRIQAGERVRLLCHCRPHVRCHTEFLKAHLEQFAPPERVQAKDEHAVRSSHVNSTWPGKGAAANSPLCPGFQEPCGRYGRALDPGRDELLCAQCWLRRGAQLKEKAGAQRLGVSAPAERPAGGLKRLACMYHARGICKYGEGCYYRHDAGPGEDQGTQDASSTTKEEPIVACPYISRAECKFGASCVYRHHEQPPHADKKGTKLDLCRYFLMGCCAYGGECNFAHGEADLRPREAREVCGFFLDGGCKKGSACPWAHPEALGSGGPAAAESTASRAQGAAAVADTEGPS